MPTHRCPIQDCPRQVPQGKLMCGFHWRRVPPDVARRLYATWDNGKGYGSEEHEDAMREALDAVEARGR